MQGERSPSPISTDVSAVPEPRPYALVFSESAADFILSLSTQRRRKVRTLAEHLARDPFVRSDYALPDEAGRMIEHLLIEDFVFAYWGDHAVCEIRIVDIEDAS
jgi:hypothetical protein